MAMPMSASASRLGVRVVVIVACLEGRLCGLIDFR